MTFSRSRAAVWPIAIALLLALAPQIASAQAQPAAAEHTCNRGKFRLILDVGHTEVDTGALSARGASEYSFNYRLASELESKLRALGFDKTTLLVTAGPGKKSLYKRMATANSMPADLFLSIHHDAVPDNFLEDWEFDGKAQHFSDRFKGHSIFVSPGNRHFRESLQFAKLIGRQMKAHDLHHTPHYIESFMGRYRREYLDAETGVYRYDKLHVLKTSRTPAVLFEAGSIINRDEEMALDTPERRATIITAVAEAVDAYCALHAPGTAPLIARNLRIKPSRKHAVAGASQIRSSNF